MTGNQGTPAAARPRRAVVIVGAALLMMIGVGGGALLSEAGYRLWLYAQHPERFHPVAGETEHPDVWFFSESRWQFHEAFGFEYGPETVHGGSASGGVVQSCWSWPANAQGNMGLIEGSYDDADLKILVFGDSWTAQVRDGLAWPNFLQQRLEAELDRSVNVVNFGRDGYGLLQMFDLAAAKVPEWRPDLAIVAFITDDLTRDRFWRTAARIGGRERILTTTEPRPVPDPETAADTAILHSAATPEWCREMQETRRRGDPVLAEMEAVVLDARARAQQRASLFTIRQSFLYDRLVHGTPFHTTLARARPSQNPRHAMTDFAEDARFLANLETLRETGVPIVLVHLAVYDELAAGEEYIAGLQAMSLLESLGRHVGGQVFETIPHAPLPIDDLAAIKAHSGDAHPSLRGLEFYGETVANLLLGNAVVERTQ